MNRLKIKPFFKRRETLFLTSSSSSSSSSNKKRYSNTLSYFGIYDTNFNTYRKYRKGIKTSGIPFFPARFIDD